MGTIFTKKQLEVMSELANYIKLKNIVINNEKDINSAFIGFLQSNATNFYFKCDEFEKQNFIKQLKI